MTRANVVPLRLVQLGILLVAAMVGLLAGLSPKLGIAAALGLVYAVFVLNNLAAGVALFGILSFLDNLTLGGGVTAAKLTGGVLFLSWLALVSTRDRHQQARSLVRDHPLFVASLLTMTAWVALSAAWSQEPFTAVGAAQRWALNLALFPVVYTAVREPRQVRWVFALLVLAALISAVWGFGTGSGAEGAETDDVRLGGTGINANELGQLLILAVVLGGALACVRELSKPARAAALAGSALCLLAMLLTVSRGALIGLAVSLLVAPFLVGPGRRIAAVALVGGALVLGGVFAVQFLPAADLDRIIHPETTGSGRTDIWRVGLRMVKANPVLGVGADNYGPVGVHYVVQPGLIQRSDHVLDRPKPAHNIYLQVLAELGPVGLLLMMGIFGFCTAGLLRAARQFAARRERSLEILARGLLIALVGFLASEFFSTALYSKPFWLTMATAVALSALATGRSARA